MLSLSPFTATYYIECPLLAPKNGGLKFDLRPSVRGQRFLRSVWVNWFETLGQEQVRSEDYARQIDF